MRNNFKDQRYDYVTHIRPTRAAFLISVDVGEQFCIDAVIPWISSHWGGGYNFFFPIFENGKDHPSFSEFLKLLRKFDPDKIFSTGQFSQDILDTIKDWTLCTAEPFQFSASVGNPVMIRRNFDKFLGLENLLSSTSTVLDLKDYSSCGQPLMDLWFYSYFGRITPFSIPSPNLNIVSTANTAQNIESNAKAIGVGSFDNNFQFSPLTSTFHFLGGRLQKGWEGHFDTPFLVVVGDSLANWALFQTLKFMYQGVIWVCPSLLSQQNANGFDDLIYGVLNDHNRLKDAHVVSADLSPTTLQTIIQNSLQRIPIRSRGFKVISNFSDAIHNWYDWAERNNANEDAMAFNDGVSVQRLQKLLPKYFSPSISDAKFLAQVTSYSHCQLSHPDSTDVPVEWHNPRGHTKDDARRASGGNIVYNPVLHYSWTGQDLDSASMTPRIKHHTLLDDFNRILATKGFVAKRSIKTLNVTSVLDLWNGSALEFVADYFTNDTSKIFETFRLNGGSKTTLGRNSSSGIEVSKKFYFSYPIKNGFTPPLVKLEDSAFDDWIQRGILIRGEKLVCQRCGFPAFYGESEYGRMFSCKRCNAEWTRSVETMGKAEPQFLYALNPLIYGLFESSSQLTILGIDKLSMKAQTYHEFESELEIFKIGEVKPFMEIDLVMNIDGSLYIGECKVGGSLTGTQLQQYVSFCRDIRVDGFACISQQAWNGQSASHIKQTFGNQPFSFDLVFLNP